jgi:cob(I)alamin adenosyltransferase
LKIYTRTGDGGTTGLFGGARVAKDHPRIEAYGTVDETNSVVGMVRALLPLDGVDLAHTILAQVQDDLFVLGADLATPHTAKPVVPRVTEEQVTQLETWVDACNEDLPPLKTFVLPGGHPAAAQLHVARTVCRRAERLVVRAAEREIVGEIGESAIVYLNRLSDVLFTLALWVNHQVGVPETPWTPNT